MAVESKGTGSPSGFKKFFNQNKTLVFLLPVLLIMIIVCIIIYIPKGDKQADSVPAAAETTIADGNKVEVLPQTERVVDEKAADDSEQSTSGEDSTVKDPFVGPMKFTGVLLNSNGENIAVVEGNGKSYVVRKGDMIGDSIQVESISAEEVVLKSGERTINLKLEQKKNSTTVNK